MVQIFLSYAREDEEKIEKLYQQLSDVGFKPWIDKKDILPGEKWKSCIQKAIRRSDFFLVCLSANSVSKRGYLRREIKDALDIRQEMLESDIYLIPVRLEDCEVPEVLRDFQWVNLFEEDGWTRLVKAIQVGVERRAKVSVLAKLRMVRMAAERLLIDLDSLCSQIYGIRHTERVIDYLQRLVLSPSDLNRLLLNEMEYFVLLAAAYLHNVGLHHSSLKDCASLSKERLYELSHQVIIGKGPSGSLDLGLEPEDPITEIAQVIQAQTTWPPTIREQSAHSGQVLRLHLLAALLRLALSLDIGSDDASPPDDPKLPLELRLQNWLRQYVNIVVVRDGLIRLHCQVPSKEYEPILKALVSGPLLRCCRQVVGVLWAHGLQVSLALSQVDVSPSSQPMPSDLWALTTNPTYLDRFLRPLVDVLGVAKPVAIPALYPYYFGAIQQLDRFEWKVHLPEIDNLQYEIRVDDMQARKNKLKIVTTTLPYMPESLSLEPGRHYRWRITARRGRVRVDEARGDFWLLTEAERRTVTEAENRLEQINNQNAAFAKGMLYMSAQLYGEAVSVFDKLIAQAQTVSDCIPAQRALAELFETLYKELSKLERFDDADRFLSMADAHFNSLREMILEETAKQARSL